MDSAIADSKQPSSSNCSPESIMIVDEEVIMCEILQYKFEAEGFKVDVFHSAADALQADLGSYSLIIVDLMEAEYNGIMFTEQVKNTPDAYNVPIVFVSKVKGDDDIVDALDAGADDFIAKPFSSRVLVARVRSVLRRRRMIMNRRLSNILIYKSLQVDMGAGTASIDGEPLQLTPIEQSILTMFLRHRNQYYERSEIRLEVWPDDAKVSDRTVDVNISRLRKKIGEYGANIINRQGYGYGFIE